MARIRQDVWKLGQDWNDTTLWYARGVRALQARPIADPTSWRYLAAMHGFDPDLWKAFAFLSDGEPLPSQSDQNRDWQQCQHQSWYFIPWHRGYLAAFEAIVAAAITGAGGPADWALPYWNYSEAGDPSPLLLPPVFQKATLPDGTPNALFVSRRYGALTRQIVDLRSALTASPFAGSEDGGTAGFAGPTTPFSHSGGTNGMLESQPHNSVHSFLGSQIPGSDPEDATNLGLMTNPDTAALDPIFWLHHANIDRLWEVWLKRDPTHSNTTSGSWLNGPRDQPFFMPGVDGTAKTFAPKDMLNTQTLGYSYDDISDPLGGESLVAMRMERLGMPAATIAAASTVRVSMVEPKPAELVGANNAPLQLDGGTKETTVTLAAKPKAAIINSFTMGAAPGAAPRAPDRVFLNLENIRGINDAAGFSVYVGLPADADPAAHPQNLAGTVALFGVRKATRTDGPQGGNGINEVLDITSIVDALHLDGKLDVAQLNVRFVPRTPLRPEDKISVGRVSIYRQSQ